MREIFLSVFFFILLLTAGAARADDWPQWLGQERDGVWRETGIVDTFPPGGPKLLWKIPVGSGYTGPAVAGGKVYVMDRTLDSGVAPPSDPFAKGRVRGSERVLCVSAATGARIWAHQYPSEYAISYAAGPRATPVVDGGRVYTLGAMGQLFCLSAETGKPIWSRDFIKDYEAGLPVWGFAAHPLVDGERLICLVGGSNGRLVVAFDKNSGKEVWAVESCPGDFGYSPPMIYEFGGRRQLIVWHSRAVLGLDPETGKRIWRIDFPVKAALTAPTSRKVGDDLLLVTSFYNGSLAIRVSKDSAEIAWKSAAKGELANQTTDLSAIMCTPAVDGDVLYGVCSYGQLRGIEARTGKRLWETMQATRGQLTPAKVAASDKPDGSERWSNAFIVRQADRYFLFNEQGDLIIAKLSRSGYEEIGRAHLLDPTNKDARRPVVWVHPAFANGCVFVRNDKEMVCYSLKKSN